jgi:hypothetical protein
MGVLERAVHAMMLRGEIEGELALMTILKARIELATSAGQRPLSGHGGRP